MPGSTSGAIFYDRKDIQTLDLGSLRKLIGTVLQEGELFSGSIFENITISAPNLTLQEAWDAAEHILWKKIGRWYEHF